MEVLGGDLSGGFSQNRRNSVLYYNQHLIVKTFHQYKRTFNKIIIFIKLSFYNCIVGAKKC